MMVKQIRFGWMIMLGFLAGLGLACSPTEAAPIPLSACQMLAAGSYTVTQNIKTTGNCFVLASSEVAIDLGGFSITGDNRTGAAITDNGNSLQQIIITHGNISKFLNGINLSRSKYVTIDSVNSSHNKGDGILIGDGGGTNGYSNTITSVTTSFNFGDGLHLSSCCNVIANVTSDNNKGNGVFGAQGFTLATNVTAQNNRGNGVELDGCCSFVTAGKISSNKGFGFLASGAKGSSCCNSITSTSIAKSGKDGAVIGTGTTSGDNGVNLSTIETNRGNGITGSSFDNLINGSMVETNSKDGISFAGRGFQLISNSTVERNKGNGITLSNAEGEDGVVLSTVESNHKAGVTVACPSNIYMLTSTKNRKGSDLVTTGAGCVDLDSSDPP
jgi:parallel beta helix pectate lyase-like protein